MALTNAERQARHRARAAQAQAQGQVDGAAILAGLEVLTRAVEALAGEVRGMRTGGGYSRQNGGKPAAGVTSRGQNRDVSSRNGEGAPTRAGDGAPPLTGVGGAPRSNDDDTHAVLVALTRPGSVGSVHDALGAIGRDLSLDRITAALVTLQGRGLVTRAPGAGPAPDVWAAVEDPALVDLAEPPAPRPRVDAGPTLHVPCTDYHAHASDHAWAPALGRFRCAVCEPLPIMAGPGNPPPGPATSSLQEVAHA